MRETRPYGSEGGVAGNGHPYPYDGIRPSACKTARVAWAFPTAGRFEAELRWNMPLTRVHGLRGRTTERARCYRPKA